jgi:hypothetical protein
MQAVFLKPILKPIPKVVFFESRQKPSTHPSTNAAATAASAAVSVSASHGYPSQSHINPEKDHLSSTHLCAKRPCPARSSTGSTSHRG